MKHEHIQQSLSPNEENWSGALWYWTCRWRWSPLRQRRVLSWWQSVGWGQGSEIFLSPARATLPPEFQGVDWHAFWKWLHTDDWFLHTDQRFHWVSMVNSKYPEILRQYESSPTVLWSNHPWELWSGPVLGVVGSRLSTAYGRLAVKSLIPKFAHHTGAMIVSGGARGIDQAAHDAALEVRQPTWIVLGCGLAHTPKSLQRFANLPARLVSPFPPHDAAAKWTFPARNQVIAQLSDGVLIVEAAAQSGSLITAAAALEFGKELLVVLPPFTSPNAAGAMRLLAQGARAVGNWQDIAQALGHDQEKTFAQKRDSLAPAEKITQETPVLQVLREQGGKMRWGELTSLVAQLQKVSQSTVTSWITALELRGQIQVELGVVRLSGMIQS